MNEAITVLGTRPEILKLASLLPALDKAFNHRIVHTGQHYDYEMNKIFYDELGIREPDFFLGVGSKNQSQQIAGILSKTESVLEKQKPRIVIVQGDTNSTLGGTLAAERNGTMLAHVEAGCRCFDFQRPEELNRVLADHFSDLLFASDEYGKRNLENEQVSGRIHLAGRTITETLEKNILRARGRSVLEREGLLGEEFVLFTLHRAENTDNRARLGEIITAMNKISESIPVIFPIHPRTRKAVLDKGIKISKRIRVIKPLGYFDFLGLMRKSIFVLSDSGGIQEESALLNTPCIILAEYTEWKKFTDLGKNIIAGTSAGGIVSKASQLLQNREKIEEMKKIRFSERKNVSGFIVGKIKEAL